VTVGMDREQVILAVGRPQHKSSEAKDGLEVEDWVYGTPPGKTTFVTFNGDKVIKVKDSYAWSKGRHVIPVLVQNLWDIPYEERLRSRFEFAGNRFVGHYELSQ